MSLHITATRDELETLWRISLHINLTKLLQFERRNPDEHGRITVVDFTELLLAYAGYPDKKKARILKTLKKR